MPIYMIELVHEDKTAMFAVTMLDPEWEMLR